MRDFVWFRLLMCMRYILIEDIRIVRASTRDKYLEAMQHATKQTMRSSKNV